MSPSAPQQAPQRPSKQSHGRMALPSAKMAKSHSPKPYSTLKNRVCLGCKKSQPSYLFVSLFPRSLHSVTEKCFSCRRVDAVGDFIKTHSKGGVLAVADQLDHLGNQRDVCAKWKRSMKNRGVSISAEEINAVLNAVKAHPALQKAVERLASEDSDAAQEDSDSRISSSPSQCDGSPGKTLRLETPTVEESNSCSPVARASTPMRFVGLENCNVEAAASALHRAANALDRARHLPVPQLEAVLQSAFYMPAKETSVANWANVLANRVELSMVQRTDFCEQTEREAVFTLMRMACG